MNKRRSEIVGILQVFLGSGIVWVMVSTGDFESKYLKLQTSPWLILGGAIIGLLLMWRGVRRMERE